MINGFPLAWWSRRGVCLNPLHSQCAPGSVKQHSSLHNVIMERGGELLNAQKVCLNKLPLFFKNIDRIFRQCNNFIDQAKMKRENQVNLILRQEIVPPDVTMGVFYSFLVIAVAACVCVCCFQSLSWTTFNLCKVGQMWGNQMLKVQCVNFGDF